MISAPRSAHIIHVHSKEGGASRRPLARRARRATALGLIAAAGLLAGCLTVGKEFPVGSVTRLEIGETTRQDVRKLFGEPWRTGVEDGKRTWTYGRYRYSAFGDAQTRDLVVRFDAKGVVASYSFNSTFPEDANL